MFEHIEFEVLSHKDTPTLDVLSVRVGEYVVSFANAEDMAVVGCFKRTPILPSTPWEEL